MEAVTAVVVGVATVTYIGAVCLSGSNAEYVAVSQGGAGLCSS